MKKCPECGTMTIGDEAYCPKCSAALLDVERPEEKRDFDSWHEEHRRGREKKHVTAAIIITFVASLFYGLAVSATFFRARR